MFTISTGTHSASGGPSVQCAGSVCKMGAYFILMGAKQNETTMLQLLFTCIGISGVLANDMNVLGGVFRAGNAFDATKPVSAAEVPGVNFPAMWAQAVAADAPSNASQCQAWLLQYEFSLRLMPERAPLLDVFDALQLSVDCGITPPSGSSSSSSTAYFAPRSEASLAAACDFGGPFYVDAHIGSDLAVGSRASPFSTLPRAISATRMARLAFPSATGAACIVLRGGVHFLSTTIHLGPADSGLIISGMVGDADPAWVSGGVSLGSLSWSPYDVSGSKNIYVTTIPTSIDISSMPGLNTIQSGAMPTRLFRATYPDYDQEQFIGSLPDDRDVLKWVKPPIMSIPELFYKDLNAAGLKNDSTMREYNIYATGRGGPCAHWANDGDEWAYVCSNSTAGGWEEIERGFASTGQLGFPMAMQYDLTKFPNFANWTMPPRADPSDWSNTPRITVWHNQGWYQGTYAITDLNTPGLLNMSADGIWPAGGWQGGRTMENRDPNNLTVSQPLGSGPWFVSNIFEELTAPGEYYFEPISRQLYVFYNATAGTPPPSSWSLVVSQLEVFFNLTGTPSDPVTDVTFAGFGLRDQRNAQLDRWHDPSGGDWGIRRAGLFHLEGTENVVIEGNTFYRTDANAIFLAAYNRNATIAHNEFAYIGMSAVITFGRTIQDDGTEGEQPWGTVLAYNKVHEIGTYQLQSSFWFNSKATLTRAEGNIVFNIPRAAINFNDGLGGGNNVTLASIFNTCRHSGDHG